MVKKVFSILRATTILGFAVGSISLSGNAQTATVADVRIVENKLPNAEITATGIGYPPRRRVSPAQKRLLAQRAATVDAYRILAGTLSGISGYIEGGRSGYIRVSGYIKGAAVIQVREFADGKIEVDLSLPVSLGGKEVTRGVAWDKIIADISKKGYSVYYLRLPERKISEEEWLELMRALKNPEKRLY